MDALVGRVARAGGGEGIHSELGNSIPGWRTTWSIPRGSRGRHVGPDPTRWHWNPRQMVLG